MPKASSEKIQSAARSFSATLERMRSRLNWVIVHIPFEVARVWGIRSEAH